MAPKGVLLPIHRIRFRFVQALDLLFLILMGDWGGYSTYALIRKNEYYMRRNLIQIYYGTHFGGMQQYTNNWSRNRCGGVAGVGIQWWLPLKATVPRTLAVALL